MNSSQIDSKLFSMLNDLPYFSILSTSLQIRLADHAAALCGCRSTRQMDSSRSDDVDEEYCRLYNILQISIYECLNILESEHEYKKSVILMDDVKLEYLLEDTLFEMTICDDKRIFSINFLNY